MVTLQTVCVNVGGRLLLSCPCAARMLTERAQFARFIETETTMTENFTDLPK